MKRLGTGDTPPEPLHKVSKIVRLLRLEPRVAVVGVGVRWNNVATRWGSAAHGA